MAQGVKFARTRRRGIFVGIVGAMVAGAVVLTPVAQGAVSSIPFAASHAKNGVVSTTASVPLLGVPVTESAPEPGGYGPAFQAKAAQVVAGPTATPNEASPRVVGGELANSSEFPGVVGIRSRYLDPISGIWYQATCTGTVLSSTKVLTASHCTTGLPFGTTYVIAGRNNLDIANGGFVSRVASTWTHQNYSYVPGTSVPIDDVSVLTLRDPLPAVYTPVTLSNQGDQSPYLADTPATIVGYGVTVPGVMDAGVLHKAIVPIKSDLDCQTAHRSYDPQRMLCAGAPASGIDTCHGDSGGPIFVGGLEVGVTDWGTDPCATTYGVYERMSNYADLIRVDINRPSVINLDWTGDGHSDLFTRESNGDITQWNGAGLVANGDGGFTASSIDGHGFQAYTKVFRVSNWFGDGKPAVMGRDALGGLWLIKGTGDGFFDGAPVQVGSGWNIFSDIMVVNNWTGDGRPNLMGRTLLGKLYLYTSNGLGGWLNNGIGLLIGTGWNIFNTVLTPGPWLGDGRQSLIGRTALLGELLLYTSDGAGGWANGGVGVSIGTGWNSFRFFMSPGDWNGDNMIDLVGVQPDGVVKLYKTNGYGSWLDGGSGQVIKTGWSAYNAIF